MQEKNIYKNIIWSLISKGAAMVASFLISQVMLKCYGTEINGLVASINNFLSVVVISDMGISTAVQIALYSPLAEKDNKKTSGILVAASKFYIKIGGALMIYMLLLSIIYPRFVETGYAWLFVAGLIMILGAGSVFQYLLGITRVMLLNADCKGYVQGIVVTITNTANTVLCIALARSGASVHIVKAVSMLCFLANPIIYTIYVGKNYSIDWKQPPQVINQKWNGVAQHISEYINAYTDIMVLTFFSTLANVSVYAVYNLPLTACRQALSIFSGAVRPVFGRCWAKEQIENFKNYFYRYEFCLHFVGVIIYGTALSTIVPFVRIYTKGMQDADNYVAISFSFIITLATFVRFYFIPESDVINSVGHLRQTQSIFILAAFINVGTSVIGVVFLGLDGVAVGTLLSAVFMAVKLSIYVYRNILKESPATYFKRLLKDILVMASAYMLCFLWRTNYLSYISWGIMAAKTMLTYIIVSILVNYIFERCMMISVLEIITKRKLKGDVT